MAQNERIEAAINSILSSNGEIKTSIEGVAKDVTFLKDGLPTTGGMTEEEVAALATRLEGIATATQEAAAALKTLDESTNSETSGEGA